MDPRPTPPNFLKLLEESIDKADHKEPRPDYRHNPSSATAKTSDGVFGACLRSLYYKAVNEPVSDAKPFTTKLQAGFGNAIHDYLTDALLKSDKIAIVPESPGKVTIDPLAKEISFRLDGLVTHNGEQGCLEIKTMQSYGVSSMVKEGGPKDAHLLQVLCYFGTNPDLSWASLVYFGRDNAYRAEYHIYRDPESKGFVIKGITPASREKPITAYSFADIVARWKELEDFVERKQLPARDYQAVLTKDGEVTAKRVKNGVEYKTDFQCSYCSWKTKCWSLPDAQEASKKVGN